MSNKSDPFKDDIDRVSLLSHIRQDCQLFIANSHMSKLDKLEPLPLNAEAFSQFGDVIQAESTRHFDTQF